MPVSLPRFMDRTPLGGALRLTRALKATLLCASFGIGIATADDWPQWLGSRGDSIWRETGIAEKFPPGGPVVRWRQKVGPGYTGPSVSQGRVYLMDRIDELDEKGEKKSLPGGVLPGKERVLCLDAESGKVLWEHSYDCPYKQISYPSGPRTTPTVDGEHLYTLGTMGDFFCFEAATGKQVYHLNLAEQFATKPPVWGYSAHPLIDGDQIILLVGGEGSAVVAIDKHTGKEIWRSLTATEVGYAPPVLYEKDGERQLIVWHDIALHGLDPQTGKVLWTEPFPEEGDVQRPTVTISTPRIDQDRVFVSDAYKGSLMLSLGNHPASAEPLWGPDPNDPQHESGLNSLMTTPFFEDGHLYGVNAGGELRCFEASTGKLVWSDCHPTGDEPAIFATCFLVKQADRFFIFNDQGFLIIAKLTPQGYQEIDRAKLLEPVAFARGRNIVWSHPAFANKCVFARNDAELICVDLAAPG